MSLISKIAKVSHTDAQTIRLALQQGCEWGMAIKKPDSRVYTYILYPAKVKELFDVEVSSDSGSTDDSE